MRAEKHLRRKSSESTSFNWLLKINLIKSQEITILCSILDILGIREEYESLLMISSLYTNSRMVGLL